MHAAIAAAFADQLVDDDALVGIGEGVALAAAAFFGGAGLVVDQHRDAGNFGKLLLHRDQIVAVMDGEALRPFGAGRIFVGLVGDDDDALGAFGCDLARHLRHRQAAVIGLAAGHRHRVVEQDLVGDVGVGGDGGADRHVAGMVIGAVAEILENVVAVGERRLADPVGAFAAHMGVAERRAVHPLRHVMAADARIGAHAFRHHGRRIVRAAGAEIGNALRDVPGLGGDALEFLEPRHAGDDLVVAVIFQQPLADADRDLVGIERAFDREQPIAVFIALADAERLVRGAVKLLADLHFEQRALLLDDDDEIEPLGKILQLLAAERPGAAGLEQADAELVAPHLVDAQFVERLADVEIALAGGDDADLRIAAARGDDAVELVGANEGQHGVALVIVQARFLGQDRIVEADVEAARRHREIGRRDDVDALKAAVDRGCGFYRLVHGLERDPGAGEARHRPAVEAVIEHLLHAGGVEDRNHHVDEVIFGLVRGGRGFGGVVVAHQRQYAAAFGGAGEVGVAEHVAGAVDAGALAVPHAEDAVVFALAAQFRLLRAPYRGGGEVLVDAALEADVAFFEERFGAEELAVEPAQRGAAIAGDEARGIEPVAAVELFLHQAEADQGLEAGHEYAALAEVVFVVELDVAQRHYPLQRGSLPSRGRYCQRACEYNGI